MTHSFSTHELNYISKVCHKLTDSQIADQMPGKLRHHVEYARRRILKIAKRQPYNGRSKRPDPTSPYRHWRTPDRQWMIDNLHLTDQQMADHFGTTREAVKKRRSVWGIKRILTKSI